MKKIILLIIMISLIYIPANSFAQDNSKLRNRIISMLSGFETSPPVENWIKLGNQAPVIIMALIEDPSINPFQKAKCYSVLAYFPTEPVKRFLINKLENNNTTVPIKRRILKSLAIGFKVRARQIIAGYLQNDNEQIRDISVQALEIIGDQASYKLIEEHIKSENSILVKNTSVQVLNKRVTKH